MTDNLITEKIDELSESMKDKPKQDSIEESAELSELAPDEQELPVEKPKNSVEDELAETKDRFLRLAADFDNYKKISQREQQNSIRFANESLVTSLLPIVDNLEHAIAAQKKSGHEKNDILIGVEMVLKQLQDLLGKFGVAGFTAKGLLFDPARHEALGEQEDDTVAPGTVVTEYQKGYLLHNRLLRPARVAVAKKSGNS